MAATSHLDLDDLAVYADAAWRAGEVAGPAVLADGGRRLRVEPVAGDTLADNRTPVGRSFLSASTMIELAP